MSQKQPISGVSKQLLSNYFDCKVLGRIGWLNRVKLGLIDQEGKLFLSEYAN